MPVKWGHKHTQTNEAYKTYNERAKTEEKNQNLLSIMCLSK